jgi:hypothetical protein
VTSSSSHTRNEGTAVGVVFLESDRFPVRSSVCSEPLKPTHRRTHRKPGTSKAQPWSTHTPPPPASTPRTPPPSPPVFPPTSLRPRHFPATFLSRRRVAAVATHPLLLFTYTRPSPPQVEALIRAPRALVGGSWLRWPAGATPHISIASVASLLPIAPPSPPPLPPFPFQPPRNPSIPPLQVEALIRNPRALIGGSWLRWPAGATPHYEAWAQSLSEEGLYLHQFRETTIQVRPSRFSGILPATPRSPPGILVDCFLRGTGALAVRGGALPASV